MNQLAAHRLGVCCPTCGQTLPNDDDLHIDEAGIVVRSGKYAVLTKLEHDLLSALVRVAPRVRSKEKLLTDLYQLSNDEPEIKIIDVVVCKLRKKLNPLNVKIETVWGVGYRMVPASSRRVA